MHVTVRYFAAARAAAGVESEVVGVAAGSTVDGLLRQLAGRGSEFAAVLARCSVLYDGIAVRDPARALIAGGIVDVLPPFAGG